MSEAASEPGGVAGWALSVMDAAGAAGAAAVVALENVFPPVPSEVVLPLAGFAAGQGRFGVLEAILWTTAGSTTGALVLYALGAWLGTERLRRVAGRLPLTTAADVDRANAAFARHGGAVVLLGRMVPLLRSVVSVPAGVTRMPVPRFLLLTAAGSGVWNTAFVLAGYALGRRWHRVEPYVGWASSAVLVLGSAAVLCWLGRRWRARRRAGASP
ncbi:membrane protein DedA, SNARE-associated domain [Jatrophihabitans endophyticus]|uniref:Membrane protein DedA, SNARE-associated domain n=1 Tax=Jatrophihabitans endophyticus TaxID=1206085 RepID=A0A1M5L265_9ACTN|nr:DedA family protein [Jatrophihabitans endophyticus]SHG59076.1 membrane protein DedA, SNARE-associated domain [Jatrophihabitans endophyticus]